MNKFKRKYFNPSTNFIDEVPSDSFGYGISHAEIEALPKNANQEPDIDSKEDFRGYVNQLKERQSEAITPHEPMVSPKWALDRKIYNFPASNYQEKDNDWPAPSANNYMNCICVTRQFIGLPREDKKRLLIDLLGFMDAGLNIGGNDKFIYKYSHKPFQIEIFMSNSGTGELKEIVKYDYSKNIELKMPLNGNFSYQHIVFEIFGDLYKWNFDKFELNNDVARLSKLISDTHVPAPILNHIPIIEFSKFIAEDKSAIDFYTKKLSMLL